MALHHRMRRWPAGVILLVLAAVFFWIGRRPSPRMHQEALGPPPATPSLTDALPAPVPEPAVDAAAPAQPEIAPQALSSLIPDLPEPVRRFGFPTDNLRLLESRPEQFFMFVDRYTPSGQVQVWQGGDYGFVRNPRQTEQGTVFTKFHEGVDIAPMLRDEKGEPRDEVRAVADGIVAYVTATPRSSNYGHYIVVLHQMGEAGVFYSLYAHLRTTDVQTGMPVLMGGKLGMLGYTGDGIDRRRAHVHLEIGLIMSERFDQYYARTIGQANPHGNFHGTNLIGINAAAFLQANHADPQLMPDTFLRREEVYFKVLVPNRGAELELVTRHPWLRQPGVAGSAWEISFTGPGVPVAIAPSDQTVGFPTVSWVKPFPGYHSWNTRSLLGGSGNSATLTTSGNKFMTLVSGDF